MMTAALSGASRRCLCFGFLMIRDFGATDKGYVWSARFRGLSDQPFGGPGRPPPAPLERRTRIVNRRFTPAAAPAIRIRR